MTGSGTLENQVREMARLAKKSSASLAPASTEKKNSCLLTIGKLLDAKREEIKAENQKDLVEGKKNGLSAAMIDRLRLSDAVIDSMIDGLGEVCNLPDPVGAFEDMSLRPNGLRVGRMRVPIGVVSMIYESRPNVTIDAAALCLKTGNSVLLRGGSEAIHSNLILAEIIREGLLQSELSGDCVQVIPVTDREAVNHLLQQEDYIDLVIPRGGEGLIRYVSETSRIPVLKHYKGVCHIYVDSEADLEKAVPIIINSKVQRPGVCNALEGLLVHKDIAETFIPTIVKALHKDGVTVKGCKQTVALAEGVEQAADDDWGTEFLDLVLVVKVVDSVIEAKDYIQHYGSNHTESILTENYTTAMQFLSEVDASAVMVNASTRFNDGGQLGLGTEIGISTTKLHAYGPMGLTELTTRKFVVFGMGQIRD
ncbi:glutamate-5-semialdehyde dehydrogenase [Desulfopila sp. IMCC35008]|uniref:glutamate-5-semialdehyde dehydrogenase n=1 Tax=Desulfopila sp. IMCC35008 TaxID=2653858 RepID=UPI0013D231A3|nr:glutamate-5-semialdehyde dehydrogenase [Desulfopila sp. IMCC35008]